MSPMSPPMEGNPDGGLTGTNAVNAADTPRARSVPEDCLMPRAALRSREGDCLDHFQSSPVTPRTTCCCVGEREEERVNQTAHAQVCTWRPLAPL